MDWIDSKPFGAGELSLTLERNDQGTHFLPIHAKGSRFNSFQSPPCFSMSLSLAVSLPSHPISIVRIVPPGPCATLIKHSLLSYFPSRGDVLLVANKYFCAQLQLLDDLDISGDDYTKDDGVILVFDGLASNPDRPHTATTNTTFASLTGHHDILSTKNIGDLLQLCVGVSLTELSVQEWRGKNHEEEFSNRILWCLDREYEYVEANLSLEGQEQGHEERDKDGFARVVEALQGTVWSSAVMDQKKHADMKNAFEQVERNVMPVDIQNITDESSVVMLSVQEYIDDDKEVDDVEYDRRKQERLDEQKMESFESLMRQASDLRGASKDGTLPDETRREQAAELALALMNQLGLDDEDESSVEE